MSQSSFLAKAEPKPQAGRTLADDITDEVIRVRVAKRAGRKASFQRARIARAYGIEKRTAEWKALRWALGAGNLAPFREIGRAVWASLAGNVDGSTACYCCGAEQTKSVSVFKEIANDLKPTGAQIDCCSACEGLRLRRVGRLWFFVCPEHGTIEPLDVAQVRWAQHTVTSAAGDRVGMAEYVYVDKKGDRQ